MDRKPQLTGSVKEGAKHLRGLLQKYDIVLTDSGFKYEGKSPEYQALNADQIAELECFLIWWWGMLQFAAGPVAGEEAPAGETQPAIQ